MLTDEIGRLSQGQQLYSDLQFLRAACRKFLDGIQSIEKDIDNYQSFTTISGWLFLSTLGELRGVFGVGIGKIAILYGIDITGDLINIIPS